MKVTNVVKNAAANKIYIDVFSILTQNYILVPHKMCCNIDYLGNSRTREWNDSIIGKI